MRHHLNPRASLRAYEFGSAILPELAGVNDRKAFDDPVEVKAIAAASILQPMQLPDADIAALLAFLKALEDPAERLGVPDMVPSGLPVDR